MVDLLQSIPVDCPPIQGIKKELPNYISRNCFNALLGESSVSLAKEAFQRMDVKLHLSMHTAGVLEGCRWGDYRRENLGVLQTLSDGLDARLRDGNRGYKDDQYCCYEDPVVVPEAKLDGC